MMKEEKMQVSVKKNHRRLFLAKENSKEMIDHTNALSHPRTVMIQLYCEWKKIIEYLEVAAVAVLTMITTTWSFNFAMG